MTHRPTIDYAARLAIMLPPTARPVPAASWYVTHGLGKPAQNTYTEVAFTQAVVDTLKIASPAVADELVRRVAVDLYGTAWAFTYPPDQYADAIERHGITRRELVIVTDVDVYDSNPREDTRP